MLCNGGNESNLARALYECGQECQQLKRENKKLRDVLHRIHQWDMLDVSADGVYWSGEIGDALAAVPMAETIGTGTQSADGTIKLDPQLTRASDIQAERKRD